MYAVGLWSAPFLTSPMQGGMLSDMTVSRPLFVEEHGLRLLLEKDGVGIELPRECYEAGDWAMAITEAYEAGKPQKESKRSETARGMNLDKRDVEGRELAKSVMDWVREWGGKLRDARSQSFGYSNNSCAAL